ncbi:bifunctional transcriptional activator/DNA repair enzyme AdaA [Heyndrickxia acidicola]|uniref:Ada metal-binding domain-containing protein n=1 Tax=Heyndrickxia acidicola TaxID=209389 RepID=A0ABU6MHE3_9BACI|nr:Ada metal-binding domain-containing protein [Heyndrickxia acidicola]MED1204100.1 Ada metal-binding domain-containing protein [Heyndrickxia acidicola]
MSIDLLFDEMWEKFLVCDGEYDGIFFTAVKTTKIYCRPSCRSRKPKKSNVEFYFKRIEAEKSGYRPCKRCQPEKEQTPQMCLINNVISFLLENYKQNILLEDISKHVGVSSFYLERLFKQLTSETPRTYLEKVRIDKASHLLKTTDLPVIDICFESGFRSLSNFYKVFRGVNECSPSHYRKKMSC